MATVHTCDRCGCEIGKFEVPNNTVQVPSLVVPRHKQVDLCDQCVLELRVFLGLAIAERIPDLNITP